MKVLQQECFGPVLPIMTFSTAEEGIALANDSEYGLGASVWTGDRGIAERLARSLRVGIVWVNDVNVAFPEAPWGGIKRSGQGLALSEFALYEYVQKKHINFDTSDAVSRAWWYPYQPHG